MSDELKISEQFRLRFEQLCSATNRNPQTLVSFFQERPQFEKLAQEVKAVADRIDEVTTYRKILPQVSPAFIQDWKDYLYKWKAQVEYVVRHPLLSINIEFDFGDEEERDKEDFRPPTFDEFKSRWYGKFEREAPEPLIEYCFDPQRHDGGRAVAQMIALVGDRGQDRRQYGTGESDDFISNTYLIGVEAIEYFQEVIGLDISGSFDRWNGLPTVFVPKHVSDRHGLTEKGSLYALFDDAVQAYVAGAPFAAVAMCRALLEMVEASRVFRRQFHLSHATISRFSLAA